MPAGALTVPPGERTLELRYSRVSMAAADKLRFRYRLQGVDRAWIDAGARRVAYYTKLPPGRYRFEVAADLPDAPPVSAATLDIVLAPYFRETGASRALLIAALAALALAIHRVRLGRLAGRHRAVLAERARIARDLHDTLAQGFTGIALHLEAANKRLDAQPERARESLERAKALANSSLVEARRAVWDLREEPRHDGGLLAALADTARTLGAEVPVRMQIRGKPAPLPPRTTEVLTRVGQESVTNALKHAGARELRFTLAFDDARVELRIEDDGRGFDVNAPPAAGHMGLAGMRGRVEELGGTLVIESADGSGTSVSVVLPTGQP
jgi:signal transduction histidine kinase